MEMKHSGTETDLDKPSLERYVFSLFEVIGIAKHTISRDGDVLQNVVQKEVICILMQC